MKTKIMTHLVDYAGVVAILVAIVAYLAH